MKTIAITGLVLALGAGAYGCQDVLGLGPPRESWPPEGGGEELHDAEPAEGSVPLSSSPDAGGEATPDATVSNVDDAPDAGPLD
jgi:hypothetical protein